MELILLLVMTGWREEGSSRLPAAMVVEERAGFLAASDSRLDSKRRFCGGI